MGFVQRGEMADPVAQAAGHDGGELAERFRGRADGPSARVFEGLGEIPVIERGERLDAEREQFVDEPVVEVEARLVETSAPFGQHPRPGHREAIRVQAEVGHERDVLPIPVVVIAGDVSGVAVPHPTRGVGEPVPDAFAASVVAGRPLHLVGRRRGSPDEVRRESALCHRPSVWERFQG